MPTVLFDYLDTLLADGDWTYLKLQQANKCEVVKVKGLIAPDTLVVERGIDSTEEQAFGYGTIVGPVTSVAGVVDAFPSPGPLLTPAGGMRLDGHTLRYAALAFEILGATEIVGGNVIARDEDAYGCCDGNNDPAAVPPIPYYYTSLPYPIEAIERMVGTASFTNDGRFLTADTDYMVGIASCIGGTLSSGLQGYTNWTGAVAQVNENIKGIASILSGTLISGYQGYGNWPAATANESIQGIADIFSGTLVSGLIQYTNWINDVAPESMNGIASITGGTLV